MSRSKKGAPRDTRRGVPRNAVLAVAVVGALAAILLIVLSQGSATPSVAPFSSTAVVASGLTKGQPDAPVHIIEYSDFQ